jgi:3-methyladenine DNA glycosylase AlkD
VSSGKGSSPTARAREAVAWLRARGSAKIRDEALTRYGITASKAFGIRMGVIQGLGKKLGRDHDLALALWDTEWYEARLLTAYVDEPAKVTLAQMDRWAKEFDNWGICDTLCFALWDRTPHAWAKIEKWKDHKAEFVKRSSYALIASIGVHDKKAPDARFLRTFPWMERAATDDRNFVKKGVSWALRVVGRRNPALHKAATQVAKRMAASDAPSAVWIGKDALREFAKVKVRKG